MKNILSKSYITIFFLLLSFVTIAQPGSGSDGDDPLEGPDAPSPIDDYVWVLGLLGFVFVFMKFRDLLKDKIKE